VNALLEIEDVDAGYGVFQALFGVTLDVAEGEAVAVIGANGAGKSTLLSAISGEVTTWRGEIRFDGEVLAGLTTSQRVRRGISLVPEGRRIFPSLTVEENLLVGAYGRRQGTWTTDLVLDTFPMLTRLARRSAARLSGGEQQALAIGRALMANARVLLLDEVSLGLAPAVINQLYAAIAAIKSAGTTLVIVEQDISRALDVADRVYCLLGGCISLSGVPGDLSRDEITRAYFGVGDESVAGRERASASERAATRGLRGPGTQ
jgi:branched-chain amino acid transport system ATP-binding protein